MQKHGWLFSVMFIVCLTAGTGSSMYFAACAAKSAGISANAALLHADQVAVSGQAMRGAQQAADRAKAMGEWAFENAQIAHQNAGYAEGIYARVLAAHAAVEQRIPEVVRSAMQASAAAVEAAAHANRAADAADNRTLDMRLLDASMRIKARQADNPNAYSLGSCVYLGDGIFVTAWHVAEGSDQMQVELRNGGTLKWVEAVLIASDTVADCALVRVSELPECEGVGILGEDDCTIGDELLCVGGPSGVSGRIATQGWLADKGTDYADSIGHLWVASNAAYFGNSGGAMYHVQSGKLIGILVAGVGGRGGGMAPNVALFVPSHFIVAMLEGLTAK